MPGNAITGSSQSVQYNVVNPTIYGYGQEQYPGNVTNIYPNQYYKFGTLKVISITLAERDTAIFQEYMYEFTAKYDTTEFYLKTSGANLYWPRPIEIKAGHTYQVSILNQIVLWTEVELA